MSAAVRSATGSPSTAACITNLDRSPPRHSRDSNDVGDWINFTVGRPWGKTAFITGYMRRDLTFSPLDREFFTTASYGGIQRKFGQKLTVSLMGEYIRSWRVQDALQATAQALRPAGTIQYIANKSWSVDGQFAYSTGESFQRIRQHLQQFLHHLCTAISPDLQRFRWRC